MGFRSALSQRRCPALLAEGVSSECRGILVSEAGESGGVRHCRSADVLRQEGSAIRGELVRGPAGDRGLGTAGRGYAGVGMGESSCGPGWRSQPVGESSVAERSVLAELIQLRLTS